MGVDLLNQIVLRWDSDSDCSALLASGGIDAVVDAVHLVGRDEAGPDQGLTAVKAGVWPGARASARSADGSFTAGASQRAWIDANGYLVAWSKALFPDRAPVLGYLPDSEAGIAKDQVVSYDSLELALVDAWAAGGNYLLAPDAAYRNALLRGDPAATAAWAQLGRTARWLKENQALLRQPPFGTITVLVEPGEATAEIAALMFRQSGSPELVSTERVPAPDARRRPLIVAAGIRPPSPALRRLSTGACHSGRDRHIGCRRRIALVEDPRSESRPGNSRTASFYTLGAGRVLAYKEAILDPGDFALDVLDLAADRRPVRLWDASASIAMVSQAGAGSGPVLRVVNYGSHQSRRDHGACARHLRFGNPFASRGATRKTANLPSRREYGDCAAGVPAAGGGGFWLRSGDMNLTRRDMLRSGAAAAGCRPDALGFRRAPPVLCAASVYRAESQSGIHPPHARVAQDGREREAG